MSSRVSFKYPYLVALLLMAAYTFNAMDRTMFFIIAASMKAELRLSDAQVGLLGGTAFAALYAFGGVAIARLAERSNRVNIIATALIVWSSLTALCGATVNFMQFFLVRAGVGLAESGCTPPAHSLISDYFPPSRRTSVLSVYTCGISLGYILAAVVGGYVAEHYGWRMACAIAGVPGILIAIAIKALVREPPRGTFDAAPAKAEAAPFSWRGELAELAAVGRGLMFDRPILHMVLGVTVGAFAAYGFYAFVPLFFRRAFGLGAATAGVLAAVCGGAAVGIGILMGGFVADALARRNARWYALVPAIGGLIALPFYGAALIATDWPMATVDLSIAGFFQYVSLGPTFGVVQNAIGKRRRATAAAFLYIALSVVALGLGPPFTGWVIDRFAHASAIALATRYGLLVTLVFFGWAALHYFLAAAGIGASLRAAASSVQSDSM